MLSLIAMLTGTILVAAGGAATTTRHELAGGTLHVAMLVPASGDFSVHNTLLADGAQIAVNEIDAAGGIGGTVKLDLIKRPLEPDTSPEQVVASLADQKTDVLILPCDLDSVPGLAAAAAKRGMLMLAPCNPDPSVAYPTLWPVGMAGNAQAAQLVAWARGVGAKNAYILTASGPGYLSNMTRYLKQALSLLHVPVVGESVVPLGKPLPASVVRQLKHLAPYAIVTPIYSPYLAPMVEQLRKGGVIQNIYATDGFDAQQQLEEYGQYLANVFFGAYGFAGPAARQFIRDYHLAYHNAPSGSFPGLGFETVKVLQAAVLKAQSAEPAAIGQAFANGFTVPPIAIEAVTYTGHGAHLPSNEVGIARIVSGQRMPLNSTDPVGSLPIPKP
jgi:branched-chain amino acid transport system substrate-binding protein